MWLSVSTSAPTAAGKSRKVLTQQDMHEYNMHTLPLYYVTMTRVRRYLPGRSQVMFENDDVTMTLGEVLEKAG
jgi:2,3-bisphosphoglycerate-independent phosphoglycerate mutase